jgi:hypothetical protein
MHRFTNDTTPIEKSAGSALVCCACEKLDGVLNDSHKKTHRVCCSVRLLKNINGSRLPTLTVKESELPALKQVSHETSSTTFNVHLNNSIPMNFNIPARGKEFYMHR